MTPPTTRPCPVCLNNNPKDLDFVEKVDDEQRIQCKQCKAIYFTRDLSNIVKYNTSYNMHFMRPGDISKAGIMAAAIGEFCKKHLRDPLILEAGCGNGLTLWLLKQQGFRVKGLEPDPAYCLKIVESLQIPMTIGLFESADFKESFDLIYSSHTIEHNNDPRKWFERAKELLNPGGYFWLDTPDTAYAKQGLGRWHHFQTRHQYEHLVLLSVDAVLYLAEDFGFHIVECQHQPSYQSLYAILQKPFTKG
jgi:SAM-dependent methyltransferase